MQKSSGGAAFPIPHQIIDLNDPMAKFGQVGISAREYFAAHAPAMPDGYARGPRMQASALGMSMEGSAKLMASWAYEYADAMLAERAK